MSVHISYEGHSLLLQAPGIKRLWHWDSLVVQSSAVPSQKRMITKPGRPFPQEILGTKGSVLETGCICSMLVSHLISMKFLSLWPNNQTN